MRWAGLDSPIDRLAVATDGTGLCGVRFALRENSTHTPRGGADYAAEAPAVAHRSPTDGPRAGPPGEVLADVPGLVLPSERQRLITAAPQSVVDGGAGVAAEHWLAVALRELQAYFAGELTVFTVPLSVRRGSAFELAVWAELTRIPYGETRTYGEVAAAVSDAGAARAVGVACNRNPLPLVVPCHRVVGAGGKLVGFGGGLPRKRYLLELESRVTMERAWR